MKTRLTIVCENSAGSPFGVIGEHGFACYVETDAGNYLFDTGQGFGIVQNTLALGRDLRVIRAIGVSHGHYDHTGGLPAVLRLRGRTPVYGHPGIFMERIIEFQGGRRDIGIPFRRGYLESLGADFRLSVHRQELGPDVWLTGQIPRKTAFEKGDAHMTAILPTGDRITPDPLPDDLSLVVEAEAGLIVVLGCAHAGIVNILEYVLEKTGRDRIYAVIGGTHLGFCEEAQFEETVKALDRSRVEKIGVSHCTGLMKASLLHARLKERFFFGCVGSVVEG